MKVSELIEVLKKCSPDANVCVAYDSMVCIYDLEKDQIIKRLSHKGWDGEVAESILLCAMDGDSVKWHVDECEDDRGRFRWLDA